MLPSSFIYTCKTLPESQYKMLEVDVCTYMNIVMTRVVSPFGWPLYDEKLFASTTRKFCIGRDSRRHIKENNGEGVGINGRRRSHRTDVLSIRRYQLTEDPAVMIAGNDRRNVAGNPNTRTPSLVKKAPIKLLRAVQFDLGSS